MNDSKPFKGGKVHVSKKSISEKKTIRLNQLLNKSSVNTKLADTSDDDLLYQIRVINCEEEDGLKG